MSQNLWSGRFSQEIGSDMARLSYSLFCDQALVLEDLEGSIAHSQALVAAGVLTSEEGAALQSELKLLLATAKVQSLPFKDTDEDIHMAIERLLTEKLGDLGKKIHTGRSRNDQVATDFKLWVRRRCGDIINTLRLLQKALVEKATEYEGVWMPGYTHVQQAQPLAISHYLLSFFWALERDVHRYQACLSNHQTLPLGSGALAGSAFPYDRKLVANQLGFPAVSQNSIDATSHRDFALEFLADLAITSSLLSRYAEDFVYWSSKEFGYIRLPDAYTTGSSMMPQKRNPDSMELIRGKTGRMLGNFTALFTAVKGAPLCYSRDLQEDKEPVFDSVQQVLNCLEVMTGVVAGMVFNKEQIKKQADPAMLATDIADALVKLKLPFRDAHFRVGELVKTAELKNTDILHLTPEEWQQILGFTLVPSAFTFDSSLEKRALEGGTAPQEVKQQLIRARELLSKVVL